jgi:hypothetical protein
VIEIKMKFLTVVEVVMLRELGFTVNYYETEILGNQIVDLYRIYVK